MDKNAAICVQLKSYLSCSAGMKTYLMLDPKKVQIVEYSAISVKFRIIN